MCPVYCRLTCIESILIVLIFVCVVLFLMHKYSKWIYVILQILLILLCVSIGVLLFRVNSEVALQVLAAILGGMMTLLSICYAVKQYNDNNNDKHFYVVLEKLQSASANMSHCVCKESAYNTVDPFESLNSELSSLKKILSSTEILNSNLRYEYVEQLSKDLEKAERELGVFQNCASLFQEKEYEISKIRSQLQQLKHQNILIDQYHLNNESLAKAQSLPQYYVNLFISKNKSYVQNYLVSLTMMSKLYKLGKIDETNIMFLKGTILVEERKLIRTLCDRFPKIRPLANILD